MIAEWVIRGERLCLSIAYQKPNETSSGTGGCSSNWQVPITTLAETAEQIVNNVKKEFNWREVSNLDGWKTLEFGVS